MKTPVTYPCTLAADQEKTIALPGNYLHVRSCSVGSLEAAFDDDPFQTFYPGATYPSAKPFEHVRVKDSLGGGCTLILIISDNPLRDVAYDEVVLSNINTAIAALQVVMTACRDELQGGTTPIGYNAVPVGVAAVEVVSLNAARKGCFIQAHPTNTGLVYVGFDNTVGPAKYMACLSAGEGYSFDDYRGVVWVEADAAAQEVGYGEW